MALQAMAADGDTITVPSGTFHWSTEVSLTKGIALLATSVTNVDAADCPFGPNCVAQGTIIIDDKNDGNRLISFRGNGSGVTRVSGFTFTKGTFTTTEWAIFEIFGSKQVRIDNCSDNGSFAIPGSTQYIYSTLWIGHRNYGVMDHCVFPSWVGVVKCYWGDNTDRGDYDWTQPAGWGGPNFFFVETNWMEHGTDIHQGGKLVVRHNHMHGDIYSAQADLISALIVSHGPGRGYPGDRGGRAYEVYLNDIHWHNAYKSEDGNDCGTGLYWGNTFDNQGMPIGGIALDYYRQVNNYGTPFYQADGNNAWDLNDPTTHTLLRGIDQPGCGSGDAINRAAPAWPHQALEPLYEWNNVATDTGTNLQFQPHQYNTQLHQGVDYYDDTPMPGYTPYVYPHPLVTP